MNTRTDQEFAGQGCSSVGEKYFYSAPTGRGSCLEEYCDERVSYSL